MQHASSSRRRARQVIRLHLAVPQTRIGNWRLLGSRPQLNFWFSSALYTARLIVTLDTFLIRKIEKDI